MAKEMRRAGVMVCAGMLAAVSAAGENSSEPNRNGELWFNAYSQIHYYDCGMPTEHVDDMRIYPSEHRIVVDRYHDYDDYLKAMGWLLLFTVENIRTDFSLDRVCTDEEWAYVTNCLSKSNVPNWKDDYEPDMEICDGESWRLEMINGTNIVRKCSGSNAWPKTFDEIHKIWTFAEEHPMAASRKLSTVKCDDPNCGNCGYHTVEPGETMWGIAVKHNISLQQLCALNGRRVSTDADAMIREWDRLKVRESDASDYSFLGFTRAVGQHDVRRVKAFMSFPIYRGPLVPPIDKENFDERFNMVFDEPRTKWALSVKTWRDLGKSFRREWYGCWINEYTINFCEPNTKNHVRLCNSIESRGEYLPDKGLYFLSRTIFGGETPDAKIGIKDLSDAEQKYEGELFVKLKQIIHPSVGCDIKNIIHCFEEDEGRFWGIIAETTRHTADFLERRAACKPGYDWPKREAKVAIWPKNGRLSDKPVYNGICVEYLCGGSMVTRHNSFRNETGQPSLDIEDAGSFCSHYPDWAISFENGGELFGHNPGKWYDRGEGKNGYFSIHEHTVKLDEYLAIQAKGIERSRDK